MAAGRILRGLPGTGPSPAQFSAPGERTHGEGVVVEIMSEGGASWVGNFRAGHSSLTAVHSHPNGSDLLVVAGGRGYVVNAATKALEAFFPSVTEVLAAANESHVVLTDGLRLIVLPADDAWWQTPRISWDGMRGLRLAGAVLSGEAWDVIAEEWRPFEVDLVARSVSGGCNIPDPHIVAAPPRPWWRFWRN